MSTEYLARRLALKQGLREKDPPKEKKPLQQSKPVKSDGSKEEWFQARRLEMTGVCKHCQGKSCRDDDENFRCSIAHILPKAIFKSVAMHPLNWIELCFWPPSCHTNLDNGKLDLIDLNCFNEVIEKFLAIYPAIDKAERKHIPDVLMQYVKSNS